MAEDFVLMTHPDKPDQPVRQRKVDAMKALGYVVAGEAKPRKTKATKATHPNEENA